MPNTIAPDDDVAVTSAVASMRRHIAQALSVSPLALGSLPEPIRQRMLEDVARLRECDTYGHHIIPEADDLFVCVRCAKCFKLAA